MKKIIYLSLLLFISCSSKDNKLIDKQHLTFKQINSNLILGRTDALMKKDSLLFLASHGTDSLLFVVNLIDGSFVEKCQKGQGPNEYLSIDNFGNVSNLLGFYDRHLRSYNNILFDDKTKDITFKKSIKLDSAYYHVVPTAFDYFVGIGPYRKGLFKTINLNGKVMGTFFEQPYRDADERKTPELARAMAYQGRLTTSPDGKRMAHAIFMSQIISFYKLAPHDVDLIKSCADDYPEYQPELGQDSYASAMKRSNKLGYMDVFATKQYVYALLSGRSTEEYALSAFLGNRILVYTWEGELVKELVSDIDLQAICVSSDDKTLYAVGLFDNYELVIADL
ncbi:BF3164 family lipoprotein [uncultured Bacteroides sp.]|uniref:BF3164 family lipoprotein n=1 Tax=uncultured Bacteroides sp. TaxID=162156 RepID=UPI002AAB0C8B|nr:BF3164 family lipoprotein [uncultured Bacteroides sp.]